MSATEFDYVVVGSGAGGGPLAANLARAGHKVLVLEAGGDPCADDKSENEEGRLTYEVPIYHARSTEYKECAWDFFVRHYTDDAQQAKDEKRLQIGGKDMIWYPRAGTLGGCTSHNAMITVVPQDSDWDYIAKITGDESWSADRMRPYFTRLERYVPPSNSLQSLLQSTTKLVFGGLQSLGLLPGGSNGRGSDGWLPVSQADPTPIFKDASLLQSLLKSIKAIIPTNIFNTLIGTQASFDPNDTGYPNSSPEGIVFTPLAIDKGKRVGPREYLLRVQKQFPGNLTIKKHALATRVVFEGKRAVGVEYIDKAHVYRADPAAIADPDSLQRDTVRARCEVILAGGAFNSPQLLMLSGVGPRAELEKFGIPVVADLPGVGENLQDRYEVGVVSEFKDNFVLLEGGTFSLPAPGERPDPLLEQWKKDGTGIYATNGNLIGVIQRSKAGLNDPDLYIFALPGYFKGYKPGYAKLTEEAHNRFTWAILKARTSNTGSVRLTSDKPWDRPSINFRYFGDGARKNDPDLEAVLSGIKLVRKMNASLSDKIKREEVPGDALQSDNQLREFIMNEAWGHHASCTNRIGADDDEGAVLDSRFRVRKTEGLRVVDASVFPRIPGYFIVSAIYMISEKATDVILEDGCK